MFEKCDETEAYIRTINCFNRKKCCHEHLNRSQTSSMNLPFLQTSTHSLKCRRFWRCNTIKLNWLFNYIYSSFKGTYRLSIAFCSSFSFVASILRLRRLLVFVLFAFVLDNSSSRSLWSESETANCASSSLQLWFSWKSVKIKLVCVC